jgi:hypothetical protein
MTCDETRAFLPRNPLELTSAERVGVALHLNRCPVCEYMFNMRQIEIRRNLVLQHGRDGAWQIIRSEKQAAQIQGMKDLQDPEIREMVDQDRVG